MNEASLVGPDDVARSAAALQTQVSRDFAATWGLDAGLRVEKHVRGATAGFNTPTFVVDAPGGGGKRDAHSFEHYDRVTGISVFESPNVSPGEKYVYFDPIDQLPLEGRERWADPREHARMIDEALARAR